ncbi:MAG TPA: hypothetical protein VH309_03330 [Elusimicrobiota bacterium]|nr:hypothetical protein [Elusimicrobiota bacterium]
MKSALFAAALLSAVPAGASSVQGGSAAFAVAYGAAAYAIVTDRSATAERVTVRRLGLDGGALWEQRYGTGRTETPVGAAVTSWGGLSIAGDNTAGCFAAHWMSNGTRKWDNDLQYGSDCHVRAVIVDANGNTFVLATTTVGTVYGPGVWKIDKLGRVLWSYNPSAPDSSYAFALTLDAAGDGVTVTTAANGPSGWTYANFDVDSNGRPRDAGVNGGPY